MGDLLLHGLPFELKPRSALAATPAAIGEDGWLEGVERIESPNQDERPAQMPVELAVVHAISLPPEEFGGSGVFELFTNSLDPAAHPYYAEISELRVSAHFLVRRDGHVVQFVPTTRRAWHAGVSRWMGRERCNDFSVGIELEGSDNQPFETAQYAALAELLRAIAARHPVGEVTGHSDIAPGRKTDPGPHFDWTRLGFLLG